MRLRDRLRSPFARPIPSPAPLPTLQSAFSRRAALFGAVTVSGALAGSAMASVTHAASGNDARLADLAASLDHTLAGADHALEPKQNAKAQYALLEQADATLIAMTAISADTLAGCASEGRAYLACDDFDVQGTYKLGRSLSEDVIRLDGGRL